MLLDVLLLLLITLLCFLSFKVCNEIKELHKSLSHAGGEEISGAVVSLRGFFYAFSMHMHFTYFISQSNSDA